MGNSYTDSDGNKISKQQIDRNVTAAKKIKLRNQIDEHGYNFCEQCGDPSGFLDCSHRVSVKQCQEDKNTPLELAWDIKNIDILCRRHHKIRDKLHIQ